MNPLAEGPAPLGPEVTAWILGQRAAFTGGARTDNPHPVTDPPTRVWQNWDGGFVSATVRLREERAARAQP